MSMNNIDQSKVSINKGNLIFSDKNINMEVMEILKELREKTNKDNKKELIEKLSELKKKIEDSEDGEVLKCIINFISLDDIPWKNDDISIFTKRLYELDLMDNTIEIILEYFKEFKGILKYLLSIDDIIENKKVLCAFKFKLLSGNKRELIEYIQKLKPLFKNEKEIEDILKDINLNNYIQINFIHELIRILFDNNKDTNYRNLLEKITININKREFLRCELCFDILYCYYQKNVFNFICNNGHITYLSPTQNKIDTKIIVIKCKRCQKNYKIYQNIFKCLSCNSFYCADCKENHKNECFQSQYINLDKIGYICEKHNKIYNDCCFLCDKNLCEICKYTHHHMSKPNAKYLLISDDNLLKLKKLEGNNDVKNFINYNYATLLEYMNVNNLFNFNVYNTLNCLNGCNRQCIIKEFFSEKFGDEIFKNYYKELLIKAEEGSIIAIEALQKIFKEYEILNIKKSGDFSYDNFIKKCKNKRNKEIKIFLEDFKFYLIDVINSFKNIKEINETIGSSQRIIIQDNKIHLSLIKNIAIQNSNRLSEVHLRKIICQYISDWFITELIDKYPNHFSKTELTLNNMFEIIKIYGNNKIDKEAKNNIYLSFKKLGVSIKEKDFDLNKYCENNNDLIFVKDIEINNVILRKEEINFIVELLFWLKKNGNEGAHPNINPLKTSFIKNIQKELYNMENNTNDSDNNFYFSEEIYKNIIENDSVLNIEQKNKVKNKLEIIVNKILNDFNEFCYVGEINTENLLNFFLKNNSVINTDNSFFLRILKQNIDKIINEETVINVSKFTKYKKKISDFNSDIINMESYLKNMKNLLSEEYFKEINMAINFSFDDLDSFSMHKLNNILRSVRIENIKESDKNAIVLFIFGMKLLNMNDNFEAEFIKLKNKISEIICEEIICKKIEKIYLEIEDIFNENDYYLKGKDLIEIVKQKIMEKKDHSLFSLEIDINRICFILKTILGNNPVKWLTTSNTKNISPDTYLFYKQNYA